MQARPTLGAAAGSAARFCTVMLLVLGVSIGCGGDKKSTNGGNKTVLQGTITASDGSDARGAWVRLFKSRTAFNSGVADGDSALTTAITTSAGPGTAGTTTNASFGFEDIAAGFYFIDVWKDVNGNKTIDIGDFYGWAGTGDFPGSIDGDSVVVPAEQTTTQNITGAILANRAPTIQSMTADDAVLRRMAQTTITVTATDLDGDNLNYNYSTTDGVVGPSGNTATWTAPITSGTQTVTVIVDDGTDADTGSVAILVNEPPTIGSLQVSASVLPGATVPITTTATDPESDPLTYSYTTTGGSTPPNGATSSWTAPVIEGMYQITVVVSDGHFSDTATENVNVTSAATNEPPVITNISAPLGIAPGGTASITTTATDPDSDPLTYTYEATRGNTPSPGASTSWTAPMTEGFDQITAIVSDGQEADTVTFTIAVGTTTISGTLSAPPGDPEPLDGVRIAIYDNDTAAWISDAWRYAVLAFDGDSTLAYELTNIPSGLYFLDFWLDLDPPFVFGAPDRWGWYDGQIDQQGNGVFKTLVVPVGGNLTIDIQMYQLAGGMGPVAPMRHPIDRPSRVIRALDGRRDLRLPAHR